MDGQVWLLCTPETESNSEHEQKLFSFIFLYPFFNQSALLCEYDHIAILNGRKLSLNHQLNKEEHNILTLPQGWAGFESQENVPS